MTIDYRRIVLTLVVFLVVIRFWIEIVTTTLFKDSNLIYTINSNSWFHHYQIGVLVIIVSLIWKKLSSRYLIVSDSLLAFGMALFVDQYTFVLGFMGLSLPFGYRSLPDYLVLGFIASFLMIFSLLKLNRVKIS